MTGGPADEEGNEDGNENGSDLLGELLGQFEKVREQAVSAAAAVAASVAEGSAGGGSVVIRIGGDLTPLSVRIDPAAVDPADVGMLEDLVLAALSDALEQLGDKGSDIADVLGASGIDLSAAGDLLQRFGLGDILGSGAGDLPPPPGEPPPGDPPAG